MSSEKNSLKIKGLTGEHKLYLDQTVTFVKQILSFLPRAIPDYTDHGNQHPQNLEGIFYNFFENFKTPLSEEEIYIIYLAIWLHDIGLIITKQEEKKKHNENSIKIMESKEFVLLEQIVGKDTYRKLKYLVKFHSSHTDLNSVPTKEANVRLRLICAIFRLIDGCDITSDRTTRVLYNILTDNKLLDSGSIPFWKAHINISNITFKDDSIVIDCDDAKEAKTLTDPLAADLIPINAVFKQEKIIDFKLKIVESPLKEES